MKETSIISEKLWIGDIRTINLLKKKRGLLFFTVAPCMVVHLFL